ncbi:class I adenylate-forming enzyme family protein [Salarchaeum sp. JOR-1]|uniref:class I adenylate-forming enzyme family protein n=1 Tax=Salarchaeum sp. JOR-1 TaxID=2599399 RepID=UPI0011986DA4|nr:long-chain-fatty-acid--CoA ligase [Salarchaeum sp. JOR-1]QDX40669.1 long-chain-fatty-acid--CoA ligase [Salarchaeum sp. JOR-1]
MYVDQTTLDYLDRAETLYDDLVGVIADDGTEYTYGEFAERVHRLSNALTELGVEEGDRVALLSPNTHYFLETIYATNQLGVVNVPMNYRLTPEDYEYILNDADATAVIADYELAERVEEVRDEVPTEHFVGYEADGIEGDWLDYETLLDDASAERPDRPDIAEGDDATVNYTSGTTGDPKGVVRTHRTEHWHALVLSHHMEIQEDDTYLWTLPMFHCNGWGHVYAITGTGGTHVCQREFDAAGTLERIRTYDVSYMCGAPTVLNRLIDYYESNDVGATTGDRDLRITTAGSAPPRATIRTIEDAFGWRLIQIYGLTETAPIITTSNSPRRLADGDPTTIKTKQGHAALNTEIRVVDEDGRDVPRDDETVGEIVVRGNQVMDRYLNKPDITHEAFNDRASGFFHTGDLATMDENGMIAIQDRKKDIIISGGENISSIDVEDTLFDHPDIAKAAVIPVPSDEWGETPKALVVQKDDAALTEDDVVAFARENMATYKAPTSVEFVESLPETATGKVQKYQLRQEYWEDEERMVGQG